jgi:SPP1 family predicted phage head-tail adaptor
MTKTPIGEYRNLVLVQAPGPGVPDGDGGTTSTWADLTPPTWYCRIAPATEKDLERVAAGTVLSTNLHIVKGAYRGDITTGGRLIFNTRRLNVTGVSNPEERNVELVLVCVEVVA